MRDPNGYVYKWLLRCMLFMFVRMTGASRLVTDITWSDKEYSRVFPDSSGWIERFIANSVGKGGLNKLMTELEFHEPPELLSLRLCQTACPSLDMVSSAHVVRFKDTLNKRMVQYRRQHGQWPVPQELIKVAVEEGLIAEA